MKNFSIHDPRKGQVILITIIVITGTLIGALTIGGLLILYQLRQAGDITRSAQSIFAADAGIEWGLYQFFKPVSSTRVGPPVFRLSSISASTTCYNAIDYEYPGRLVSCTTTSSTRIESQGTSQDTRRSLELFLVAP